MAGSARRQARVRRAGYAKHASLRGMSLALVAAHCVFQAHGVTCRNVPLAPRKALPRGLVCLVAGSGANVTAAWNGRARAYADGGPLGIRPQPVLRAASDAGPLAPSGQPRAPSIEQCKGDGAGCRWDGEEYKSRQDGVFT